MRRFAIAGLQLVLTKKDNLQQLAEEVRLLKARLPWVQMVVLGELSAYGPGLESAEERGGAAETAFCDIARRHKIWLIPGSYYQREGDRIFNLTPVINPAGEVIARYRKMYPFVPYEVGVASGDSFCVFDVPGVARFGVSICYDMWFPETTRAMAWMGAEAIIHPTMTNTIDRDAELAIARASAAQNQLYFIDINVAGRLGFGRSVAYGPGGELLHAAGTDHEAIALELDFEHVRHVRERGWNGIGQMLKSFRDTPIDYPQYRSGARKSPALEALGRLERPPEFPTVSDAEDLT